MEGSEDRGRSKSKQNKKKRKLTKLDRSKSVKMEAKKKAKKKKSKSVNKLIQEMDSFEKEIMKPRSSILKKRKSRSKHLLWESSFD